MRIAFITTKINFEKAGGSVIDLDLKARFMVESGNDVTVVTAFSSGNNFSQSRKYKLREENFDTGSFLILQYKLYKFLKSLNEEFDVIYVDGQLFVYGAGLYRLLGGKISVVSFHNIKLSCEVDTHGNENRDKNFFKKIKSKLRWIGERYIGSRLANHADAFIFTTPMVAMWYNNFGFSKEKTNIFTDFSDTVLLSEKTKEYRKKQNYVFGSNQTIKIVASGRMLPEKGFDILLNAISKIKTDKPFQVIISGDGPQRANLGALAKKLNIDNLVSFPGWVSNNELNNLFFNSDIFVFPKWWIEYSSVLLVEAMAYGVPCVVPAGGGLEWLIGEKGSFFKDGSIGDLTEKIEELINNKEKRVEYGRINMEKALDLDYRKLGKLMENIFKNVIK